MESFGLPLMWRSRSGTVVYSWRYRFHWPSECPDCNGGVVFVSDKDRVADYPGGPLRGQWPGAFARASRVLGEERG
jgi:hypothetical protein